MLTLAYFYLLIEKPFSNTTDNNALLSALTILSLIYVLQLSHDMSQNGIKRCLEVENYMSAVDRNLACSEIEPEPGYGIEMQPPVPWPKDGVVNFECVSLSYSREGPRVLKDISFTVHPGEKFGIAGRPGAGKSSIALALFRMPECGGKIKVDGVRISNLELQASRRSMSIITKEPILFMGSLRMNVDPFLNHTEREVWEVLEKCHLKSWVESLPKQLCQDLVDCGAALGPSERQLISFARALLQRSKIVIIDEATSSVDYRTDRLIQEVIRTWLVDCTVITIPHRLSTIIDYDRVMVLERGKIIELDKPEVLLRKDDGYFAHLYGNQCPS